jgi:hypothetical protein
VVLSGARWRVFTRGSLLEPLVELSRVSDLRVEGTSLQSSLTIDHESGTATIALGFGEPELVAGLLEARTLYVEPPPTETEPAPTEPAPTEPAPTEPAPTEPGPTEPTESPEAPTPELLEVRADLLTLLEARRREASPARPRRSEPKRKKKKSAPKSSEAPERRALTAEEDAARERNQRTFIMVIACIAGALTYLFFRGP